MIAALNTFPVFLIVTSRTPGDHLNLQHQMPLVHLPLARLDPRQAEELLHNVGSRAMSGRMSTEIIARADGVPLFIEELSKAVIEFDVATRTATAFVRREVAPEAVVPATLQTSLMARLDRMSLVKPVAQLAAVLGRGFTLRLLSAVAPPKGGDPLALRLSSRPRPRSFCRCTELDPPYQFKHALLQDVAYNSLLRTTRRKYHALVACTPDERFSEIAGMQPEIVARHFTEAGITDKAVGYWLQAGQWAIASSSNSRGNLAFPPRPRAAQPDRRSGRAARVELRFTLALLTPLIAVKGYASPEIEAVFERAIASARRSARPRRSSRRCTAARPSTSSSGGSIWRPRMSSTAWSSPNATRVRSWVPSPA